MSKNACTRGDTHRRAQSRESFLTRVPTLPRVLVSTRRFLDERLSFISRFTSAQRDFIFPLVRSFAKSRTIRVVSRFVLSSYSTGCCTLRLSRSRFYPPQSVARFASSSGFSGYMWCKTLPSARSS